VHNLGLLFDVDGPIASPITRTINIRSIVTDLVAMTAAGVPIAFITGRSGDFIRHQVVAPLRDAGLGEALDEHGARMFGVFEKGGAWAPITGEGMGEVTVDESVAFGDDAVDGIRSLVRDRYADTMFFDETKRAMISVEQRTDVDASTYADAQARFQDEAFELLTGLGIGLRYGERVAPDGSGELPYRIDPTIISTDIESVLLDKDWGLNAPSTTSPPGVRYPVAGVRSATPAATTRWRISCTAPATTWRTLMCGPPTASSTGHTR
jgi:hypothetical protein